MRGATMNSQGCLRAQGPDKSDDGLDLPGTSAPRRAPGVEQVPDDDAEDDDVGLDPDLGDLDSDSRERQDEPDSP